MKLLSWIFNLSLRHYGGALRYQRGGPVHRVVTFIILTAVVAGTLVLEYVSIKMLFIDNEALGILLIIIAAIIILSMLELLGVYSYFGFKNAAAGGLDGFLAKQSAKRRGRRQAQPQQYDATPDGTPATPRKRRVPKAADIFLGIYFLVLLIAMVAIAIFIPSTLLG